MKIGILGFGRSGKAVAKLAIEKGYNIFVSEINPKIEIPYPNEKGKHSEKLLDVDLVVVSPGVRDNDIIKKAREKNIPVIGEMEFASRFLKGKIVAITGTNGKTTTVGMVYNILKKFGVEVFYGGNILPGVPLSEIATKTSNDSVVVVEVSSFQLERIDKFHPQIAVITNVTPDHMDRYSSFESYLNAKLRLFINQTFEDTAIINMDCLILRDIPISSKIQYFSTNSQGDMYLSGDAVLDRDGNEVFKKEDISLIGDFFVEDAMAAALVCKLIGVDYNHIRNGLRSFRGIPHRMEVVKKFPLIINNSMCTNPAAFTKSISNVKGAVVIAGGRMKGLNIKEIASAIKKFAGFVILIGESREQISKELRDIGYLDFRLADTLEEAVKVSRELTPKILILSPGGASQDMFRDFTERGELFKKFVEKYYG